MAKENLTEKIQVLLSKVDERELNRIIARKAIEDGERPVPLSSYVRDLIKAHIKANTPEQKSIAAEKAKEIVQKYKSQKNDE